MNSNINKNHDDLNTIRQELDALTRVRPKTWPHLLLIWCVVVVAGGIIMLASIFVFKVCPRDLIRPLHTLDDAEFSQLGGGLCGIIGCAASLASGLLFFAALLLQRVDLRRQEHLTERGRLELRKAELRGAIEREESLSQLRQAQSNSIVDRVQSLLQLRSILLVDRRQRIAAGIGHNAQADELEVELRRIETTLRFYLKSDSLLEDSRIALSSLVDVK